MLDQSTTATLEESDDIWSVLTLAQSIEGDAEAKKTKTSYSKVLSNLEHENISFVTQRTLEVPVTKVSRAYKENKDQPQYKEAIIEKNRERHDEFFETTAHWTGTVTEILEDTFFAKIKLIGEEENTSEENYIEFDIHEVSQPQRHCIAVGANFSWYIGRTVQYLYKGRLAQGTVEGKSIIKFEFRRLPAWTKQDLAEMEAEAVEISKHLE